jgi:hypothetical protein
MTKETTEATARQSRRDKAWAQMTVDAVVDKAMDEAMDTLYWIDQIADHLRAEDAVRKP